MQTSIVPGSLQSIATANGTSIAESFVAADTIVLVDTSASMETVDSVAEGRKTSRYVRACAELTRLQATLAGKIAVVSFSGHAVFCPGGVPTMLGHNTDLAEALRFVRVADDCDMTFVVISDGNPDDTDAALREARKFTSVISTVFVGPPDGWGEDFLKQLATASGGQALKAHQAAGLNRSVQRLLPA
jgi:Mg-chelatase subunit ChlD